METRNGFVKILWQNKWIQLKGIRKVEVKQRMESNHLHDLIVTPDDGNAEVIDYGFSLDMVKYSSKIIHEIALYKDDYCPSIKHPQMSKNEEVIFGIIFFVTLGLAGLGLSSLILKVLP